MNEFFKRTLSGAVYVGVVVGSILYGSGVFVGFIAALAGLAIKEYNYLQYTHSNLLNRISEVSAVLPCLACYYMLQGASGKHIVLVSSICYALIIITLLIVELWDTKNNPFVIWGHILISHIMIALPFATMCMLFAIDKWLILAIFVLIWINDSGAYLVGSMTAKLPGGNHKMFPRVSPKKSWEGLIGGIMLSIGAGILLAYFGWFDLLAEKMNVYVIGAIFALVVSVFGTIGDLVESLMKRTIGVKDSGRFLPGHGGVLDRFDSILLAAPMALILITILLTW